VGIGGIYCWRAHDDPQLDASVIIVTARGRTLRRVASDCEQGARLRVAQAAEAGILFE
jgi:hypothetical protein